MSTIARTGASLQSEPPSAPTRGAPENDAPEASNLPFASALSAALAAPRPPWETREPDRAKVETELGASDEPAATDDDEADAAVTLGVAVAGSVAAPDASAPTVTAPTATAAAAAAASSVNRDLGLLDPEFRARLDRVVARMREQGGHAIDVVETYRGQARQDALYGQGRTTPGAVVTWTRASKHTGGRAADVVVDGTRGTPGAYAELAKVASEEGLRTLGARDPGHLELASVVGQPAGTPSIAGANGATTVARAGVAAAIAAQMGAPVAAPLAAAASVLATATKSIARQAVSAPATAVPVAEVATVASVAQVARVASMSSNGGSGTRDRPSARDERGARAGSGAERRDAKRNGAGADITDARRDADAGRTGWSSPLSRDAIAATAADAAATIAPASSAAHVARVLDLQDGIAAGPVSHVTLHLDNADGGEDRIRVDLRGASVGATIDVRDPAAAENMTLHLADLQRALEGKGLETDALHVRAMAARVAGDGTLARLGGSGAPWGGDAESRRPGGIQTTASQSGNPRERGDGSQTKDEGRRGTGDDPWQRFRREPKGGKTP